MGKIVDIGRPPYQPERKHRRFPLRYPVQVKFPSGNTASELQAVSNNVSLGGILLEVDSPIPQYCDVSFTMTVKGHSIVGSTQVVGEGKVLRVEPHPSGAGFAIAVKCKRPISQLAEHLDVRPSSRQPTQKLRRCK
jgi:PilZ domain-containing protein